MAAKKTTVKDLIPDDRNANIHSEYGMQRLEKGLRKNGLGRSILISSDNKIIAGNGVTETAGQIGIENVRIIETDGKEIIAVKRTDIKSGTKEFYEMALSDNIIAKENIVMDADVTNAICEEFEIEEYVISPAPSTGEPPPDNGIGYKSQYGVIVMCASEMDQEVVYSELIGRGYECKIVVT